MKNYKSSEAVLNSPFYMVVIVAMGLMAYFSGLGQLIIPGVVGEFTEISKIRAAFETGNLVGVIKPLVILQKKIFISFVDNFNIYIVRYLSLIATALTAAIVSFGVYRLNNKKHLNLAIFSGALYTCFYIVFSEGRHFSPAAYSVLFMSMGLLPSVVEKRWYFWVCIAASICFGASALAANSMVNVFLGPFLLFCTFYFTKDAFNSKHLFKKTLISVLVGLVVFVVGQIILTGTSFHVNEAAFTSFLQSLNIGHVFKGFYTGHNNIFKLWLSPFYNASFLVFPLVGFSLFAFKNKRLFSLKEKQLLFLSLLYIFLCAFTVTRDLSLVYVPMVLIAVVFGKNYTRIDSFWFKAQHIINALVAIFSLYYAYQFNIGSGVLAFSQEFLFILIVIPLMSVVAILSPRWDRWILVPVTFLIMTALTLGLKNFSRPFTPKTIGTLQKKVVYVPNDFSSRKELYRFILPRSIIKTYKAEDGDYLNAANVLLDRGFFVAMPHVGHLKPAVRDAFVLEVQFYWFHRGGLLNSLKSLVFDKNLFGKVYVLKRIE